MHLICHIASSIHAPLVGDSGVVCGEFSASTMTDGALQWVEGFSLVEHIVCGSSPLGPGHSPMQAQMYSNNALTVVLSVILKISYQGPEF